MPTTLMIWPEHTGLSLLTWLALAMMAMYLARVPAHRAIRAGSRVLSHGLRLTARSLVAAEAGLARRNRDVLLAAGEDAAERQIEQEFQRVNLAVSRDLGAYPELHRTLSDQITRIDEDYRKSTDSPPSPPSWLRSLEAMNGLVAQGTDTMVVKVLGAMKEGLEDGHKQVLREYREQSRKRHHLLRGMMPYWRGLARTLGRVDKTIRGLEGRSAHIDTQMARFTEIRSRTDRAERTLASSAFTQFFIAALVLTVAALGGFINFQLIALPMSEMVGGTSHLGGFRTSDVAALVIIMVEVAMGLFLMEALHVTRLFPVVRSLDEPMRRRMVWVTFSLLLILACVESSLAYMRDMLAADREALTQALSGVRAANPEFRWIPSLGQMIMGFILPFALTFVAIPLESFVHSSRSVLGAALVGALRALAFLARLAGNVVHHLGSVLVTLYDLIIFVPLRVEQLVAATASGHGTSGDPKAPKAPVKTPAALP
jgi:hypothetical protein